MKATTRHLLAAMGTIAGLSLFAAPITASAAGPATGTLGVQIAITSNCSVSTGNTALDFSSHASTESGPISASNGGFSVTCTNQTPYTIGLQSAASGSTTDGKGVMAATGGITQTIGYQLYQDSGFATVWGNSTSGTVNTKAGTGTGAAQSYVVYGKTTSTLNVPAATYTDTVNINVYY